ncbi:MAG: replicative DNA helicase [Nannocystaceae bacterium]
MAELRTLPHQAEAESAVLGGVLLRGREALIDVSDLLGPEDFYVPAHQAVFQSMVALDQEGEPIDVITLEARLKSRDELKLVGGIEALGKLADRYATSHNIMAHARIVRDAAMVRRLVIASREVAEEGMAELEDIRAFIDGAEQRILAVNEAGRKTGYRASRDLMLEVFRGITERQKQQSTVTGVPTGFTKLDEMTAGMQPGDLVIVAARPSMGKTAFALNVAQHACLWQARHMQMEESARPARYPVLFFSLEMGAEQLVERVLCSEAQVDYSNLRVGRFVESDYRQLIAAADRISSAGLFIDDTAAPTILEIRNSARRWRGDRNIFAQDGPKFGMIVVDYLQLVRGGKGRYDSREQEISEISRGLKALAKELHLPVVALSQLNRAVDSRADHRPMLSDLRESGAIEQDADVIMFIFREERYLNSESSEEKRREVENKAEVIVGKQRNGPVGTVNLIFRKQITRFENPASA